MLSNFRERFIDPLVYPSPRHQEQQSLLSPTGSQADVSDSPGQTNDVVPQRHWAIAMAGTVYVAGCTCDFCTRHSEIDDDADPPAQSHTHRTLPSTRSIVQVLYPPSYLGTPRPCRDPPSYSPSDSPPVRGDDAEISPLISSTTISIEETPLSCGHPDPLAQDPSLTGVPSSATPYGRVPPVESDPSLIALGEDVLEDTQAEPLPAYSRFDQRRSRFPAASDVLGPYPPLSALCRAAR